MCSLILFIEVFRISWREFTKILLILGLRLSINLIELIRTILSYRITFGYTFNLKLDTLIWWILLLFRLFIENLSRFIIRENNFNIWLRWLILLLSRWNSNTLINKILHRNGLLCLISTLRLVKNLLSGFVYSFINFFL